MAGNKLRVDNGLLDVVLSTDKAGYELKMAGRLLLGAQR